MVWEGDETNTHYNLFGQLYLSSSSFTFLGTPTATSTRTPTITPTLSPTPTSTLPTDHDVLDGLVWHDRDSGGIGDIDAGEIGVVEVTVEIFGGDGTLLQRTTTAYDGRYRFENLRSQGYRVRVTPPESWAATSAVERLISPGTDHLRLDFGLRRLGGPEPPISCPTPEALNMELVTQVDGSFGDVVAQGDTVFLTRGRNLVAVDIRDPNQPSYLDELLLPFTPAYSYTGRGRISLALAGHILYAPRENSAGEVRTWLVDVGQPTEMRVVGCLPYSFAPEIIDGGRAYTHGLQIWNVDEPTAPALLGWVALSGIAIDVDGSIAYAAGEQTLFVADISDPIVPKVIGSQVWKERHWLKHVVADGSMAYVSIWYDDGIGGPDDGWVEALDVSNPATPQRLGSVGSAGDTTTGLGYNGGFLYASGYESFRDPHDFKLVQFDVRIPGKPRFASELDLDFHDQVELDGARAFMFDHEYASMGGASFRVMNLTTMTPAAGMLRSDRSSGAALINNVLAFHNGCGLVRFDITNLRSPVVLARPQPQCSFHGYQGKVSLHSDRYVSLTVNNYVNDFGGTYYTVFDYIDPYQPTLRLMTAFNHEYGSWYPEVGDQVSGQTIFLAASYRNLDYEEFDGLYVIDLNGQGEIQPRKVLGGLDKPRDIAIRENHAYVIGEEFVVLDITDPNAPQIICRTPTVQGNSIELEGAMAVIQTQEQGIRIMSVENECAPTELAVIDSSEYRQQYAKLRLPYLFSVDEHAVNVFDLSEPMNPRQVGYYELTHWADGLDARSDLVAVADRDGGVVLLRFTGGQRNLYLPIQSTRPQ